jgi:hypothetical protein
MKQCDVIKEIAQIKEMLKQTNSYEKRLKELQSLCTHKYENGESAIESSLWVAECKICGKGSILV